MRLSEVAGQLGLEAVLFPPEADREVAGGYSTDLMSDAIAHAEEGMVWVTLQTHANVVAIAVMKALAGVVLTGGRRPDADALARAKREEVPVFTTPMMSFELVGRLWELGIGRGEDGTAAD